MVKTNPDVYEDENFSIPVTEWNNSFQEKPENKSLEEMYNEQKKAADILQPALEGRESKLREFLNALVNGDEISQLFINSELTEKAKEELIKLQQATATKNVSEAVRKLEELNKLIKESKEVSDRLDESISSKKEEEAKLTEEVNKLKKKKMFLAKLVNNDLDVIVESMDDSLLEPENDGILWKNVVVGWSYGNGFDRIGDYAPKDFDKAILAEAKIFADSQGITEEKAMKQFLYASPEIEIVSKYIKDNESLLSKFNTIKEMYGKTEGGSEIERWSLIIRDKIMLPDYEMQRVESKRK